jgi:hypothetical protein
MSDEDAENLRRALVEVLPHASVQITVAKMGVMLFDAAELLALVEDARKWREHNKREPGGFW